MFGLLVAVVGTYYHRSERVEMGAIKWIISLSFITFLLSAVLVLACFLLKVFFSCRAIHNNDFYSAVVGLSILAHFEISERVERPLDAVFWEIE